MTEPIVTCPNSKTEHQVFNSVYTMFWINASLSLELAKSVEKIQGDPKYRSKDNKNITVNGLCIGSIVNLWLHFESFINYLLTKKERTFLAESKLSTLDKWLFFSEFEKANAADKIKSLNEYSQIKALAELRNDLVHNRYRKYEYYIEFAEGKSVVTPKSVRKFDVPKNPLDLKSKHVEKFFGFVESFYKAVTKHTGSDLLEQEYKGRFIYGKVPLFHGEYYLPIIFEGICYGAKTETRTNMDWEE